jgi:outer membrane receptor protein involved in Fe transport
MNSLRAPYSRRGLRLFLGAQAFLPAYFDRLVFWLIVTAFLFTTSPTLFAQTTDNADTAGGRIAELAGTPALPGNGTLTLGLRFDNHSIFGSAVSPKAGLNLRVTDFWRIRASYGRGFRAPDLGQLFYRFLNPISRPGVFRGRVQLHRQPRSEYGRIAADLSPRVGAHVPRRNALHVGER